MVVETILFGKIEIPDTKEEIMLQLEICKTNYWNHPSRYALAKIDALEEALDMFRRTEDVSV